jgi:hypothetical protein
VRVFILHATVAALLGVPPEMNTVTLVPSEKLPTLLTPFTVNVTSEIVTGLLASALISSNQVDQSNVMSITASGSFEPRGFFGSVRVHHLPPVKTGDVANTLIVLATLGVNIGITCTDVKSPEMVLCETIEALRDIGMFKELRDTTEIACSDDLKEIALDKFAETLGTDAMLAEN